MIIASRLSNSQNFQMIFVICCCFVAASNAVPLKMHSIQYDKSRQRGMQLHPEESTPKERLYLYHQHQFPGRIKNTHDSEDDYYSSSESDYSDLDTSEEILLSTLTNSKGQPSDIKNDTTKRNPVEDLIASATNVNCSSAPKKNQRLSSSFVDLTARRSMSKNQEDEMEPKIMSSIHVGEDVTLCWIETTTIKENKSVVPPLHLVIREYTISFENSATIPDPYLECSRLPGEVEPGIRDDKNIGKKGLFRIIDEDTKKSRVVNFTVVDQEEELVIWKHKRVQCGVGPVVTKNILEWSSNGSKNPKKRVEIKVSPKLDGFGVKEDATTTSVRPTPMTSPGFDDATVPTVTTEKSSSDGTSTIITSTAGTVVETTTDVSGTIDSNTESSTTVTECCDTDDTESSGDNEPTESIEFTKSNEPTEPIETTGSTTPSEPTESIEPIKPSLPTEPTEITESTTLSEPTESIEPIESNVPTEPTETTEFTTPSEPTESIEPIESSVPTEPTETTEFTAPSEPTESIEPIESSVPTEPTETTKFTTPSEPTESIEPIEPSVFTVPTEPTETIKSTTPNELTESIELIEPTELTEFNKFTEPTTENSTIVTEVPLITTTAELQNHTLCENGEICEESAKTMSSTEPSTHSRKSTPNSSDESCSATSSEYCDISEETTPEKNISVTINDTESTKDKPQTHDQLVVDSTTFSDISVTSTSSPSSTVLPSSEAFSSESDNTTNWSTMELTFSTASVDGTVGTTTKNLTESTVVTTDGTTEFNSYLISKLTTIEIRASDTDVTDTIPPSTSNSTPSGSTENCTDDNCYTTTEKSIFEDETISTNVFTGGTAPKETDRNLPLTTGSVPTTMETRRSTPTSQTGKSTTDASSTGTSAVVGTGIRTAGTKHRLALKIKVMLEHINEHKEKQNLIEVEKHLLLNEDPREHNNSSILNQVQSLNDSVSFQKLQNLFNCSSLEKLNKRISKWAMARYSTSVPEYQVAASSKSKLLSKAISLRPKRAVSRNLNEDLHTAIDRLLDSPLAQGGGKDSSGAQVQQQNGLDNDFHELRRWTRSTLAKSSDGLAGLNTLTEFSIYARP